MRSELMIVLIKTEFIKKRGIRGRALPTLPNILDLLGWAKF